MPFTLGNKEAIVNPGVYTVKTKASLTAVADANFTAASDILVIQKFGTFSKAAIESNTAARAVNQVLSTTSFTAPTAAQLGILATDVNKLVKIHIRFTTSRYASEWATDFIRRGRPYVVQIRVNGGETADAISVKVENAILESIANFKNAVVPISVNPSHVSGTVKLISTSGDISFTDEVEFLLSGQAYGWKSAVTAVPGSEAVNSGKWLEENVKMATDISTHSYAVKSADMPMLNAVYTSFSWVSTISDVADSGTGMISAPNTSRKVRFTIYVNESDFTTVTNIATWLHTAATSPFTSGTWSTDTGANAATTDLPGTLVAFLA